MRNILLHHVQKGVLQLFYSLLEILGISILQGTWIATLFPFLSVAHIKDILDSILVLMKKKRVTESSLVFQELFSALSVEICFFQ